MYHLKNKTLINLTGELNVSTTSTGKEIAMMARHVNRTVRIWTNYDVLDQEFKQHSRLELGPDAWISYDLSALNKTLVSVNFALKSPAVACTASIYRTSSTKLEK